MMTGSLRSSFAFNAVRSILATIWVLLGFDFVVPRKMAWGGAGPNTRCCKIALRNCKLPCMDWDDYRIVRAVAEGGSLVAAARRLGVVQSTAFRRLNALEKR